MKSRTLRIALCGVALLFTIPQKGAPLGPYQMWDYYDDESFSNWVGYKYRVCSSLQQGGTRPTDYYMFVDGDCEYGAISCHCYKVVYEPPPNEEQFYVVQVYSGCPCY